MKKTTLLLLLSFINIPTYSQEDKSIDEQEKNYTQVKVYSPNTNHNTKSIDHYKWAVKTDILQYIMGDFGISAEYLPIKRFSAEFGIGATYSLYESFTPYLGVKDENEKFDFDSEVKNSNLYFIDDNSGKSRFKTSYRVALKYYFDGSYSGIDGWYVGLQYAYKTYVKEYSLPENTNKYELSRTKTSINFIVGYQLFTDSYFMHNIALGVGFADIKQDFMTNNIITNTNTKIKGTRSAPNFLLSYSIGFGN